MADIPAVEIPATLDMIEEADKKSKTREAPQSKEPPRPRRLQTQEVIPVSSSHRLNTMAPMLAPVRMPIVTANMIPYIRSVYTSIVSVLYTDNYIAPPCMPMDEFEDVVLFIIRSRIQYVLRKRRIAFVYRQLNPYQVDVKLPASLCCVIQSIGIIQMLDNTYTIVPDFVGARPFNVAEREEIRAAAALGDEDEVTERLLRAIPNHAEETSNDIGLDDLETFRIFIDNAELKGAIRTNYLTFDINGTHWYILPTLSSQGEATDGNENTVEVQSPTLEATTQDKLIAAFVQRQAPPLLIENR